MYDDLVPRPRVLDLTVEEPSDDFRALRDFVDCRNALKLPSLAKEHPLKAFDESAVVKEIREKLKLQKVPAENLIDLILLYETLSHLDHWFCGHGGFKLID